MCFAWGLWLWLWLGLVWWRLEGDGGRGFWIVGRGFQFLG